MPRDISEWDGTVPESSSPFHWAGVDGHGNGIVRLIDFDENSAILKQGHTDVIKNLVVKFLLDATRALGPDEYYLTCVGGCSATGSVQRNQALSEERSLNAANRAIELFYDEIASLPETDPLKKVVIAPSPKGIGKKFSQIEYDEDHIKEHWDYADIRTGQRQKQYRSAQYYFHAEKRYPKSANVFQIREIFLFKFRSSSEPLPVFLKRVKQIYDSWKTATLFLSHVPGVRQLVKILGSFLSEVDEALGWEGELAKIMITFSIPQEISGCYELKNWANQHALYKYTGTGHELSFDIIDLLGRISIIVSAMRGLARALKTISKILPSMVKTVAIIEKLMKDFHREAVDTARSISPGFGRMFEAFLKALENGVTVESLIFPSSEFQQFKFHDLSPKHEVTECSKKSARRNVFSIGFFRVTNIEFDGPVPNDWSLFMADVKIKTNTLAWLSISSPDRGGSFELLKSSYYKDITVDPVNVVTD
jgi:hypothetical protein